MFSLIYYSISGILFLLGLVFNRSLTEIILSYESELFLQQSPIILILILGLIFHIGAVIGSIYILKHVVIKGVLIFVISSILILALQLIVSRYEGYLKIELEIFLIISASVLYVFRRKKTLDQKQEKRETTEIID